MGRERRRKAGRNREREWTGEGRWMGRQERGVEGEALENEGKWEKMCDGR